MNLLGCRVNNSQSGNAGFIFDDLFLAFHEYRQPVVTAGQQLLNKSKCATNCCEDNKSEPKVFEDEFDHFVQH